MATRSSETVKKIESMVKITLESVEEGQLMANNTAKTFKVIIENIDEMSIITEQLMIANKEQKQAVATLMSGTQGLDKI